MGGTTEFDIALSITKRFRSALIDKTNSVAKRIVHKYDRRIFGTEEQRR
jgi:hypothetical protein